MKIFNNLPMLVLALAAMGISIPVANAADRQAPTAPSLLRTIVKSASQIDLSWNSSTDNVGVIGYKIYRKSGGSTTQLDPVPLTATSYSDTGLAASTTYTYQVAAYDAIPNFSKLSNTAIARTNDLPISCPNPYDIPPLPAPGCPQLNSISQNCVNVKSPPSNFTQGAKGDGITDDTAVIQAHINALGPNDRLYFEPGTYLIDAETRLRLKDYVTLHLNSGATLKAKPNNQQNFGVLIGKNVSNVNIIGGIIQGERYQHKGTKGEWGHGIEFYNAHNMVIQGTISKENWGDGLYIGATTDSKQSGDINVCNFTADSNRRQGASITSATSMGSIATPPNGVTIKNSSFKNTGGTLPEAGVDVEPNLGESVDTVTIENSHFLSNRGSGIMTGAIIRTDPNVPSTGSETHNVTMRGNIITGNGANGGAAIFMSLAVGNTIDSNTISGNLGTGIYMEGPTYNQQELNNLLNNNNQIINNNIDYNPGNTVPLKYGLEMYQVNANKVQCNTIKNTDNTKPNAIVVQFYNYLNNIITQNAIINGILKVFPTSGNTVEPNFTTLPESQTCPAVPT